MRRYSGLTVLCLGLLSSWSVALPIPYSVEEFLTKGSQLNVGWIQKDNQTFFKTGLSSGFDWNGLAVSGGVDAYFPSGSGETQVNLTFQKIKYDFYDIAGAQWGRLTEVTLGQGMLMDNYDSGSGGNSSEYTPQQSAFRGYLHLEPLKVEGLLTARNLVGAHVSYTLLNETFVLGSPLLVGGTYVNDGQAHQFGYAADIALPIGGDFLTAYIESAWLDQHGNGQSVGLRGNFFGVASYRGEYRILGQDFIPGYFDRSYEQAPPTFSNSDPTGGVLLSLGTTWLDGYIQSEIQYEQYRSDTLLSGALAWKPLMGVAGVAHYTQPFRGDTSPELDTQILLSSSGPLQTLVGMRQIFKSTGTETSYSLGAQVSLTKLMGLPF